MLSKENRSCRKKDAETREGKDGDPVLIYEYLPVKEVLYSKELGAYVSYGLRVSHNGKEIAMVSDVTTDPIAIERFCKICRENELSPIHLMDVIEDFLTEDSLCDPEYS